MLGEVGISLFLGRCCPVNVLRGCMYLGFMTGGLVTLLFFFVVDRAIAAFELDGVG